MNRDEQKNRIIYIQKQKELKKSNKEIAKELGITIKAYEQFCTRHNLSRTARALSGQELEILKERRSNKIPMQQIANELNITLATLERLVKKEKLKNITKFNPSEENIRWIKAMIFQGTTQKEIADKFNIGITALQQFLKKQIIDTKNYKVHHNYFCDINDEERAYFLGLFYADGYNHEDNNQIKLKLHNKDYHIMETFAKALTYGDSLPPITKESTNKTDVSSVQLTSKQLCQDLKEHGCMQAKSLILRMPTRIKPELMRHFIRGYFDGDGSVYYDGIKIKFNFTGCEIFIKELHAYLVENVGLSNIKPGNLIGTNAWQARYTKKTDIELIKLYLYADSNTELRLKRKYDKFFEIGNAPQLLVGTQGNIENNDKIKEIFMNPKSSTFQLSKAEYDHMTEFMETGRIPIGPGIEDAIEKQAYESHLLSNQSFQINKKIFPPYKENPLPL